MIKQISVFIENKKGRLAQVTNILGEANINIHALSIADTTDFGILRLIVSDFEKTRDVLKNNGYTVKITDVVAVALENTAGSLANVLKQLEDEGISVEYMYAFTSRSAKHEAMVILRLSNQDQSLERIKNSAINFISPHIIESLS